EIASQQWCSDGGYSHRLLDGVEVHGADGGPVASRPRPAARRSLPGGRVHVVTMGEHRALLAGVARGWGHVADATVKVLLVVPADEAFDPLQGLHEALERLPRVVGSILQSSEQSFGERVVVAHAGAAEGGHHTEALQRRE